MNNEIEGDNEKGCCNRKCLDEMRLGLRRVQAFGPRFRYGDMKKFR